MVLGPAAMGILNDVGDAEYEAPPRFTESEYISWHVNKIFGASFRN